MTTLLEKPVVRSLPSIRRESISWRTDGDHVVISIELANYSNEPTAQDTLVIEAAPFGAFVPNVPITSIAIGSLDPGERRTESVAILRDTLDEVSDPSMQEVMADAIRMSFNVMIDPKSHLHWVGNLNVYFESAPECATERHCAFGLRVPAGSKIAAGFDVEDAVDYTFAVYASDNAWQGNVVAREPFALLLVDAPHEVGRRAKVTVDVRRTRDGKVVPVEFEFETVKGKGETLGCVLA
jgi:hypothetical protein